MTALTELLAAVDDVENHGDDELHRLTIACGCDNLIARGVVASACYGDLNSAVNFMRDRLPGWMWWVAADGSASAKAQGLNGEMISARADTPAHALLIAALKALVAKEPTP